MELGVRQVLEKRCLYGLQAILKYEEMRQFRRWHVVRSLTEALIYKAIDCFIRNLDQPSAYIAFLALGRSGLALHDFIQSVLI